LFVTAGVSQQPWESTTDSQDQHGEQNDHHDDADRTRRLIRPPIAQHGTLAPGLVAPTLPARAVT
jgi:hypothetical protein